MRRREFISLIGCAAGWPVGAGGQTRTAAGGIDLTRSSRQPVIQFTGTSLTDNRLDGLQPYPAWVYIPKARENGWKADFEVRIIGRPGITVKTMMFHDAGSEDDANKVNAFWNWEAPANIQVIEGGTNDAVDDPNLSAIDVCRRIETYCLMQSRLGLKIVLVGPISRRGDNKVQSHDNVCASIESYHTTGGVGQERWRNYAHRYVSFARTLGADDRRLGIDTTLGNSNDWSSSRNYIDGVHLRGDVGFPYGRALYAHYIQQQLHNLISELGKTDHHPLKLIR